MQKIWRVLIMEHRVPWRVKAYLKILLAALGLKKIYWYLKKTKDEFELKLGYNNCRKFFNIMRSYRNKILKEKDYRKRINLYSQLYDCHPNFLREHGVDARRFGFSPYYINNFFDLFADKIVLDYGCGYGDSTELLSTKAKFVYGSDASSVCIKSAKERLGGLKNVEFIINASPYLSFDNETIDAVYSNDFLEHLHPEDAFIHLTEVYRVLKFSGNYLFFTPGGKGGPYDCTKWFYPGGFGFKPRGDHIKEYTFAEMIAMLKKIGYKKIELPDLKKEVLIIASK